MPFGLQFPDQLAHLPRRLRIQPQGRLIEQQDGRLGQQRTRDGDALPHAGRVFLDQIVGAGGQLHPIEQLGDTALRDFGGNVIQRGEVFQILARGELPVDAALAGQHRAQTLPHLGGLPHDIIAVDVRRALGRFEQGAQHADGRRFARAVGPKQAKDFAALNLQTHPIDGGEPRGGLRFAAEGPATALWRGSRRLRFVTVSAI